MNRLLLCAQVEVICLLSCGSWTGQCFSATTRNYHQSFNNNDTTLLVHPKIGTNSTHQNCFNSSWYSKLISLKCHPKYSSLLSRSHVTLGHIPLEGHFWPCWLAMWTCSKVWLSQVLGLFIMECYHIDTKEVFFKIRNMALFSIPMLFPITFTKEAWRNLYFKKSGTLEIS